MKLRALWHLMRADFLERLRRYGFLVTLAFAGWLGYLVSVGSIRLWIGNVRGVYDSAWVGALTVMVINAFLSLAGFYVVKNAVERDRLTGVGQILASTPMSRTLYALGKTASNLAVLGSMVVVLAVFAVITQLLVGEDTHVRLWPLLSPFLLIALPLMALIAALTVLFEMVPGLRGGFGNIVWFTLWTACMAVPVANDGKVPDPIGMTIVAHDMQAEVNARFGKAERGFSLGSISFKQEPLVFQWKGMDWTPELVAGRLSIFGLAAAIALVAALFFDRFDPTRGPARGRLAIPARRRRADEPEDEETGLPASAAPEHATLTPLPSGASFRFAGVLRAELRLALQGQRWWWYAAAAGLVIAGLAAPIEGVKQAVLPIAWIWPILVWSPLGNREARFGTAELLFSAPRPVGRQLPAAWLAGVLVAMAVGGGVAVRLLATGDLRAFAAWLAGAMFIPMMALALGVWSGSGKLFEALYLLLWYIGPMNRTPQLDYLGATGHGQPLVWLAATAALAAAAALGRRQQLGR
ncbi:MAG: ABC transporter permease [Acidobacteriota bacterium]